MAPNPRLVTAPDERERCRLVTDEPREGDRCRNPARFWVGANRVDDYTHVCANHGGDVRRDGDAVEELP